jgi:hypothetical protein
VKKGKTLFINSENPVNGIFSKLVLWYRFATFDCLKIGVSLSSAIKIDLFSDDA